MKGLSMRHRLNSADPSFEAGFSLLLNTQRDLRADVRVTVTGILDDVRHHGDAAVLAYTERFDRQRLSPEAIRVPEADIESALSQCSVEALAALHMAADRIEDFHRRQIPEPIAYTDALGVRLGARWTPIDSVGVYVPGGAASYPSSVLMNALPARAAGVHRIAMVVPTPDGCLNPLVLAAAQRCGVTEIYRVGGAQAIGALAFGTTAIPAVDKIVGPGNAYVAEAKRQVFGTVGIDVIAGPSEILVVADNLNDPHWIAADLMSQAEHDTAAQAILITDTPEFADRVIAAVESLLTTLPRSGIAARSWRSHGAVIVTPSFDDAPPIIDRIAPEHLELAVADPQPLADRVRHAGAIFLGRHTPEAIGDYVAGPNHVLPTARTARYASGLGVLDFLKRTSLVGCDAAGLAAIGPAAVTLARAEGLEAHARSVAIRLTSAPS
ncbi:histidinal/histidinol dehydrogenase [Azospirillaceae bacterium]